MGDDVNEDPEHFNPHEDREKRKQVRYEYRELIAETEKNSLEFIKPESKGLHKALDRAEELFDEVKQTREAVLDSRFLVLASKLGRQQVQKLQTHLVKFDPDVFAEKLITFMGGRTLTQGAHQDNDEDEDDDDTVGTSRPNKKRLLQLDWDRLGKKAAPNLKRTPCLTFMFGPLAIGPPVRKTRRPIDPKSKDKPNAAQKVTAKQLDKVESQEEATTGEVSRVYKCLVKATAPSNREENFQPVGLFEFIVNPGSFSQTIENMFHLSFLIKDGRAKIDTDKSTDLPTIVPCEPYKEGQCKEYVPRRQVITHLSLPEFKEIVKVFNIKKPMIPTRAALNDGQAGLTNGFHGDE